MAKIIQARVDERLLHGQASVWMQVNSANTVIVANNDACQSKTQQELMRVTVPADARISFYSIAKLIEIWPKAAEWQVIYLITDSINDMFQLVEAGLPILEINIGNTHTRNDRVRVTPSVNLSTTDRTQIKKMHEKGVKFNTQSLPGVSKGMVGIEKLV